MKSKVLFSMLIVLLSISLYIPSTFSQSLTQNPTFQIVLSHDTWDGAKTYTVDITVISTDVNPIEFATTSFAVTFNTSALNGGTVTATWVAGTTDLIAGQQPGLLKAISGSLNVIKFTGKTPPGYGNGTQLQLAPGTRFGTLKLVTSAASWTSGAIDLKYCPANIYPPNFNVYLYTETGGLGTNTDIWPYGTLLLETLLPVELSSFVSNVSGRQVNLNWETKTEVNSNKYQIERALADTKDATTTWISIGNVQAAGNSNSPRKYSYVDKNLQAGKYQYRLKMIDNDGSFKFSDVVETNISLPKDFELSQNYPNPFNPSTKIDYQVPVDAKVILEVYNIAGQKVVELVNQDQPAGYYSVSFGTSSNKLASGVYIYRIAATEKASGKNFSSIKKMMLLK